MDQFEAFTATHGEIVAQAILENWERKKGIKDLSCLPLETRWERFLKETSSISAFDA